MFSRTSRDFVGLKEAKTIGILYNYSSTTHEHIDALIQRLEKSGKKTITVGFINQKKMPPSGLPEQKENFKLICRKDLNILKHPHGKFFDDFNQTRFDLLLNFDLDRFTALHYLASMSHAKCRVGALQKGNEDRYEILLVPETDSIQPLILQAENYLNKIGNVS
jgi:hypothetical protein